MVFSLRDLPEELKAIGTLLTLDAVWRRVSNPAIRRPRLVVVDEAWLLMKQHAGAEFLFRMAKAARKHWAGLTVATQDTADVLGSDLGKAVVANAATQILLRQAPQAIEEITRTFDLSAGERQFLLSADRGQGLLSSGTQTSGVPGHRLTHRALPRHQQSRRTRRLRRQRRRHRLQRRARLRRPRTRHRGSHPYRGRRIRI